MKKLFVLLLATIAIPAFGAVHVFDDNPTPKADGPVIRPIAADTTNQAEVSPQLATMPPEQWGIDPATTRTYKEALAVWAKRAGWELVWNLPKPYLVATRGQYKGDFVTVFSAAGQALGRATNPVDITFYQGSRVVTIAPLHIAPDLPGPVATPVHKRTTK